MPPINSQPGDDRSEIFGMLGLFVTALIVSALDNEMKEEARKKEPPAFIPPGTSRARPMWQRITRRVPGLRHRLAA